MHAMDNNHSALHDISDHFLHQPTHSAQPYTNNIGLDAVMISRGNPGTKKTLHMYGAPYGHGRSPHLDGEALVLGGRHGEGRSRPNHSPRTLQRRRTNIARTRWSESDTFSTV
jgi:hypothetical protein